MADRIAAELDVFGQPRQAPDAPAAPQAAGGLEVKLRSDQRVEEPERVAVVDDLVLVGHDPEHVAGVLAQVGLESLRRNQLRRVLAAEVVDPLWRLDDEHVAVGDLPPQPGPVERLVDRSRVVLEHDAEAVPGHRADAEHVVVLGDAV